MKNLVSTLALVAVLGCVGMAQAAETGMTNSATSKPAVVKLTKAEVSHIVTECKKTNPTDKAAFKSCVTDKKKAAETGVTTPATNETK